MIWFKKRKKGVNTKSHKKTPKNPATCNYSRGDVKIYIKKNIVGQKYVEFFIEEAHIIFMKENCSNFVKDYLLKIEKFPNGS